MKIIFFPIFIKICFFIKIIFHQNEFSRKKLSQKQLFHKNGFSFQFNFANNSDVLFITNSSQSTLWNFKKSILQTPSQLDIKVHLTFSSFSNSKKIKFFYFSHLLLIFFSFFWFINKTAADFFNEFSVETCFLDIFFIFIFVRTLFDFFLLQFLVHFGGFYPLVHSFFSFFISFFNHIQPPPTTSNQFQPPPTTSNHILPPPTTSNHPKPHPTTPNHIQPHPTTPNHIQPPQTTPNHIQPHPTTPNHIQPPQTTSNHIQPPQTTSNHIQPHPTTPNHIQPHSTNPKTSNHV